MMFLDTEEVIKRVSITLGCAVVLAGFGLTYYFGLDIIHKINESQTETTALKDEANRLTKETDSIKTNLLANTKDLRSSITVSLEETKKVDSDVKSQTTTLKQLHQEFDRYRTETRAELSKLKDANMSLTEQMKVRDQYYTEQIRIRDSILEKNKADTKIEMMMLSDSLRNKDKEIADLRSKLDKEIEWRNRSFFTR